ncbi:hypothetical protein BYT27DRAFT_7141780 [Phlegmacium glaucopus]|nr:hypothetical protein BYT27DRAFT_7141780 [Phlegmacium glaucopus]
MTSESSSFAFIPRAVKKRNHPPVSSHAPSENLSVGAQVTSGSTLPHRVDNSKRTKGFTSSSYDKTKTKTEDDDNSKSAAGTETKLSTTATSLNTQKDLPDLEDLAQLVCLALSDYAVWADVDLRRKIDWGLENNQEFYDDDTGLVADTSIDDNKGYIPLAYLLRHSQAFRLVSSSSSLIINQPQTTFIKAIRTHVSHLIDVRLIIPSSTFPRNNTVQWTKPHIQTGYELRRKETLSALSKHGKKEWDALTIYVENIPIQYRNISGIIRFVNGLLQPSPSFSSSSVPRIQNISLPSHHQDQPNCIPTCKGFALVTLSHNEDVTSLLKAWSWDHPRDAMRSDRHLETGGKSALVNAKAKGKDKESLGEEISPFQVEATKFGLRVLTKAKWEELRAEYLLYRQELVDEINTFQDEGEVVGGGRKRRSDDDTHDQDEQITEEDSQQRNQIHVRKSAYTRSQSNKNATVVGNDSVGTAGIRPNSAYPPGCLVFVRNIHADTNKTTLRNLFLHARELGIESVVEGGRNDDDGLDYLDYTKGMDCCHVRLRTPLHAQQLVHHLSSNPIVQTSGLDTSGTSFAHLSSSDINLKPIVAEQVLGKREEVYWEKVPGKVRRQAVEKALSLLHSGSSCDAGTAPIASPSEGDTKKKRWREEHEIPSVDFNIYANSAYPPGCLVFIRNAHPETNKTTLRSVFSHAWEERAESQNPGGQKDEDGIDYLDYTKGMDCCHVRLRTPLHAQQLVHHLSSNPIVQTTGLDASGSRLDLDGSSSDKRIKGNFASTSQLKPLMAEQVLGKREGLYWEKVPEKVRRQAVDKALSFLHGRDDSGGASSVGSKPKKRRKN